MRSVKVQPQEARSSTSRFHRGAQPRALEHHEEWRCCSLLLGRAEPTAARQAAPDKKTNHTSLLQLPAVTMRLD